MKDNFEKYLSVINQALSSSIANPNESVYWIYDYQTMYHKGHFYIKIYLINIKLSSQQPSRIDFEIEQDNNTTNYHSINFYPVEEFKQNQNIFGCLLEIGEEVIDVHSLRITKYILNNKEHSNFTYSKVLNFTIDFEDKKLKLLRDEFKTDNIKVYPQHIKKTLWLCKCGAINNENVCSNCKTDYSDLFPKFEPSLDELLVSLVAKTTISFNARITFEENYNNHFKKLNELGILTEKHLDSATINELKAQYIDLQEKNLENARKIKPTFNYSKNFYANISDFLNQFELNNDYKKQVLNDEELEKLKSEFHVNSKKKKKKNKLLTTIIATILITVVIMYFFGWNYLKYTIAKSNLNKENYEIATQQFEALEDFLDAKDWIKDSKYRHSIDIYEENPTKAIELMTDASVSDYKESKKLLNEQIYNYATLLYTEGSYRESINFFVKVTTYLDGKEKWLDAHLALADEYFNIQDYETAIEFISVAKIRDFKESQDIYNTYVYEYAQSLIDNNGLFGNDEALEQLKIIKNDYTKAMTLFNETSYLMGENYFNRKDYESALPYYKSISTYLNSTSRINSIERIIYAWEVSDVTVNGKDTNLIFGTYTSKFEYDVTLKGGRPSASVETRVSYGYPYGTDSFETRTWKSGYSNTYSFWFDGTNPRGTYYFTFQIKENGSWKTLDTTRFKVE